MPRKPIDPERLDYLRKLLEELSDCKLALDYLDKHEKFVEAVKDKDDEEAVSPCVVITDEYANDTASVNITAEVARQIVDARFNWLHEELAKLEVFV